MKQTIPVIGMACAACSANVEKKLSSLPGIQSVSVSLLGRSALIDYDPAVISLQQMKKEINDLGYDLVIETGQDSEEINRQAFLKLKRTTILSVVFAILVMVFSMHWIPLHDVFLSNILAMLLALVNLILCGRSFYRSAWRQLLHGSANMDTLVALSTLTAFLSVRSTPFGAMKYGAKKE